MQKNKFKLKPQFKLKVHTFTVMKNDSKVAFLTFNDTWKVKLTLDVYCKYHEVYTAQRFSSYIWTAVKPRVNRQ